MVLNKYDIDFQQIAAIHNDSYTNATGIKRSNNGLWPPVKFWNQIGQISQHLLKFSLIPNSRDTVIWGHWVIMELTGVQ